MPSLLRKCPRWLANALSGYASRVTQPAVRPVSLRTVIDANPRLDELGTARAIGLAAELVHKAQGGPTALGTLTPGGIVIGADGVVELVLGATGPLAVAYAAPERLRGAAGDRRSDVFSLGAILWEALAHAPLFEGTEAEAKAAVLAGVVAPPSEYNANVPAELDAICRKALAADPAARFPSAKVMAAELSSVLDDAGYPEDNTGLAAYVATAAVIAARPAAAAEAPATPAPPVVASATPRAARSQVNQTMLGVAPLVLEALRPKSPSQAPTPAHPPAPLVAPLAADAPRARSPSQVPPVIAAEAPRAKSPSQAPRPHSPSGRHPTSLPDWAVARPDGQLPSVPPGASETAAPVAATTPDVKAPHPGSQTMVGFSSVMKLPADATPGTIHDATTEPTHARAPTPGSATLGEALARLNAASSVASEGHPQPVPALLAHAPGDATAVVAQPPAAALVLPAVPPGASPDAAMTPAAIANAETTETPALAQPAMARPRGVTSQPVGLPGVGPLTGRPKSPSAAPALPRAATDGGPVGAIDPAGVVALPARKRSASKGDVLANWEWTGDSNEHVDDDHDFGESPQTQRKRLVLAIGGAIGVIAVIAMIALAFGGSKPPAKPKPAVSTVNEFAPAPPIDAAAVAQVAIVPVLDPEPDAALVVVVIPPDAAAVADATLADATVALVALAPPAVPDAAPPPPRAPDAALVAVVRPDPTPKRPELPVVVPPSKPVKPMVVAPKPPTRPEKPVKPVKPAKPNHVPNVSGTIVDPYADDRPHVDPAVAYRAGIQLFARGDTTGALATFQSSLGTNPDYAPTWRGVGLVYEKLGKPKKAKTAFKRYLTLSPSASDAGQIRDRMEKL